MKAEDLNDRRWLPGSGSSGPSPDEVARRVLARPRGVAGPLYSAAAGPDGDVLEVPAPADGESRAERLVRLHDELDRIRASTPGLGTSVSRATLRIQGFLAAAFVAGGAVAASVGGWTGIPFIVMGLALGGVWLYRETTLERRERAARLLEDEIDRIVADRRRREPPPAGPR